MRSTSTILVLLIAAILQAQDIAERYRRRGIPSTPSKIEQGKKLGEFASFVEGLNATPIERYASEIGESIGLSNRQLAAIGKLVRKQPVEVYPELGFTSRDIRDMSWEEIEKNKTLMRRRMLQQESELRDAVKSTLGEKDWQRLYQAHMRMLFETDKIGAWLHMFNPPLAKKRRLEIILALNEATTRASLLEPDTRFELLREAIGSVVGHDKLNEMLGERFDFNP